MAETTEEYTERVSRISVVAPDVLLALRDLSRLLSPGREDVEQSAINDQVLEVLKRLYQWVAR